MSSRAVTARLVSDWGACACASRQGEHRLGTSLRAKNAHGRVRELAADDRDDGHGNQRDEHEAAGQGEGLRESLQDYADTRARRVLGGIGINLYPLDPFGYVILFRAVGKGLLGSWRLAALALVAVPGMLLGGFVATLCYGLPRATADIDYIEAEFSDEAGKMNRSVLDVGADPVEINTPPIAPMKACQGPEPDRCFRSHAGRVRFW
jgi:hypothetical protein